jgi:solute carrier family 25 thiamine pyrophosphate transporter 19
MQTHAEAPHATGRAGITGVGHALSFIFAEEGVRGLWRGNVPAVLLYATYTGAQFLALRWARDVVFDGRQNVLASFGAGAFAGAAATVATYPLDLVRTRMASGLVRTSADASRVGPSGKILNLSTPSPTMREHLRRALAEGSHSEKVVGSLARLNGSGLFAGLGAALLQIVPYIGLSIVFYDSLIAKLTSHGQGFRSRASSGWPPAAEKMRTIRRDNGEERASPLGERAACATRHQTGDATHIGIVGAKAAFVGGVAGLGAKLVVYPLDTLKKRCQVRGVMGDAAWSPMAVARSVLRSEGPAAFYRGVAPAVLKAVPATGTTFAVFEAVTRLLEKNWSSR